MTAMLVLSALSLSHFRSHRSAQLQLDGRPVAIHGANGAGKTNILEAISLLSPGRGLRRAAAEDLARRPEALGWKVGGQLRQGRVIHEIETWAEPGQPRQVRIDGKPYPQAALAQHLRMVWLVPAMDRLWSEGADGRRRFLDRIAMGFEPAHATAALDYEKAMRERNRLLRDGIGDDAWFSALEARMATAGAALVTHRRAAVARLMAAQRQVADADGQDGTDGAGFPQADLTLAEDDGGGDGPQALAEALAAGRARDRQAGRTLLGPHRADLAMRFAAKDLPAARCSTGEQKALLISLVLANARALSEDLGTPPILLLDEVAAHLDAARRAVLFDALVALGAQAFMTGTGPELFAELGNRAQRLRLREGPDGTEILTEE